MNVRQLLLVGALAVGGCATTGVSDKDLARLPQPEREQVATANRSIDVANANLATAKSGRDEAKQFRRIAAGELDTSKSQLEASRGTVDLAAQPGDDRALRRADRVEDDARLRLISSRAKLDYANRLVELREAKVNEAEANLAAAKADVALERVRIAQRNGIATGLDIRSYEAKKQDTAERLAESRAHVADLEGETAQLKTAWDDRRFEMNRTASRGAFVPPPATAEPGAARVHDERGEVNDTPGKPAVPESQAPRNNIAPAP